MKKQDIALGVFILVPILCLIIPVPLLLLDLLFGLNIVLSMIILFTSLFYRTGLRCFSRFFCIDVHTGKQNPVKGFQFFGCVCFEQMI